jgi:hypothetical protein
MAATATRAVVGGTLKSTSEPVGAENTDTSCVLQILVYQATEAISS